ncbi:MAG: hypothetical protein KJ583_01830 [Nanoarchaeota archaeon]|nr:hypothetical protein [Nanoarchaeota archaeon]MBU1269381.1 hypothetical protein [Nanoarchaeota archaeon]MBU1604032.1 hypothetical protein [Nanoarchaeota archaeon]MBU2442953.1 hypothetical protein [Nanoarchaeota archaeon]
MNIFNKYFGIIKKNKVLLFIIGYYLLFVALTLYSGFYPREWNYGFYHLKYFSLAAKIIFLAVGIIFLIPKINRRANEFLESTVKNFKFNKYMTFILISLVFLFIFWNFKSRIIYGDGFDIMKNFFKESIIMTSPLTFVIFHQFQKIFSFAGFTPYHTISLISCLFGAVSVFFLLLISDSLFKESIKKVYFFLLLMTLGTTQLFFGHVEYYTIFATGIIIYIYTIILYFKDKTSIFIPSLILVLTVLLHLSAGFLIPSLIAAALIKKSNNHKELFARIFKISTTFLVIIILFGAYIYFFEWNASIPNSPTDKYGRFGHGQSVFARFYPLFEIKYPEEQKFTLFSHEHINELVNEHLLIAPFGLFILIMSWMTYKKKIKTETNLQKRNFYTFMFVLVAFFLFYTFTSVMGFSGRQDWDQFSPVALTYSIFGNMLLINYSDKKNLKYILLIILVLNMLHLIPWIASNHLGLPTQPTSSIMSNV